MARCGLVVLLLLTALPATGNRLFMSGFETADFTSTEWTATQGSPTLSSATVHAGSYAARLNLSAATGYVQRTLSPAIVLGTTIYIRGYFRWTTFSGVASQRVIADANGTGIALQVDLTSANKVKLTNAVTGTNVTGTTVLSAGQWYRVEASHLAADASGTMEVRVYLGESQSPLDDVTISGEDTSPGSGSNFTVFYFGSVSTTVTADFLVDDIAINDGNGSVQKTWVGPGKIAYVTAGSDSSVQFSRSGANCNASSNTACVNDLPANHNPPDDNSGYNTSSGTTNVDKFAITGLPAEVPDNASMAVMAVVARCGSDGTSGSASIALKVWDQNSSLTSGGNVNCRVNGWRVITIGEWNVIAIASYSKANVNGFAIGYGATVGASTNKFVTALWANVEWTEAAAGARKRVMVEEE